MSETPETNAVCEECSVYASSAFLQMRDHARKLERERDMLRRQVEEKDRQVESLVLLFGAELSCGQCGLLGGPGLDKDSRTCCDGVPDICEYQLRRWSLEQAKKGGGGEC